MTDPLSRLRHFLAELKRRRVYRVGVVYVVVGFALLEGADIVFPRLGLPSWSVTLVIALVGVGFPLALVLAWAFDLTPEGVRRASSSEGGGEATSGTSSAGADRLAYGVLMGLCLVLGVLAGGWYLIDAGNSDVTDRSIAVLPFESVGGASSEQLAHGVHDDLLTRLSSVSDLRVISRTSVEKFEETSRTIPEIARALDVRWMVEGGVQESQDLIRVNAQLIEAPTDDHRWAETFQRDLSAENLFAIQSELTRRIARSLEAELSPQEEARVERRPTEDLEAYRLYVRGRRLLASRERDDIIRAAEHFHQAIQRDSTYARAWAGLADAAGLYAFHVSDSLSEVLPRQEVAARRALELNPELAEAHAALGLFLAEERRGPSALRALRRAVELEPSYAQAHNWLGSMLLFFGRPAEALEHARLAVELNPGNPAFRDELNRALIANGEYREVVTATERARARGDESVSLDFFEALALAHVEDWAGVRRAMRAVVPDSVSLEGAPHPLLGLADLGTGDTVGARARLASIEQDTVELTAALFGIAVLQAALGRRGEAFLTLGRAMEREQEAEHTTTLPVYLRYYYPEILRPLRNDPRWKELMTEINVSYGLRPDGSLPDTLDLVFSSPRSGVP